MLITEFNDKVSNQKKKKKPIKPNSCYYACVNFTCKKDGFY